MTASGTIRIPTNEVGRFWRGREGVESMSVLPEELWRKIMEMGIKSRSLTYKDFCRVSICSRGFRKLSSEDDIWRQLSHLDFGEAAAHVPTCNSAKCLYRIRLEKEKAKKRAAERRAELRMESLIYEYSTKLMKLRVSILKERDKLSNTIAELSNLQKVRQASVALNVWQPEVVRSRQTQMVEQCSVPLGSRIKALEMELKVCRQQIAGFEKAYKNEESRLEKAKEELGSMKYHPLGDQASTSSGMGGCTSRRKRLKRSNICNEKTSQAP